MILAQALASNRERYTPAAQMFVVVGSGPAGVACAHALLAAGATVTMLDAGLELEAGRQARLAELRSTPRARWGRASLDFLREGVEVSGGGIPLKLAYGSDFPYREPSSAGIERDGVDGKPSFARGGLSNVWGASVMPFRAEEMEGWPIHAHDLAPHYRAVLGLMPFSARSDRLADEFPLFHDGPGALQVSPQASSLLADLERAQPGLQARGIQFGASRLAVQAASDGHAGCVYCGLCMYGCPYEYIYSSATTLDHLLQNPKFTYRSGMVAERVSESGSHAEVAVHGLDGRSPSTVRADRVFVACGVFSTARLILGSLEAYDRTVRAADNCYFLLPLIRYRNRREAAREPLHTLAQVFLEVLDPSVGPHVSHLQVYTFNELYRTQYRRMLGPLERLAGPVLLGRTLLIQGYLHSELSPGINVTLRRDGRLELSVDANARTVPALAALKRKLRSERGSLRGFPVTPALRVGRPGRGFHTGATFPMRSKPAPLESDVLGRPHGFSRVHVVDASVLPALPATTITLSVMANAHRIGAAAAA